MVVGIKLNENGKTYYFNSNGLALKENDRVIVETEKGLQFGEVTTIYVDEFNNIYDLNIINDYLFTYCNAIL